MLHGVIMFLLGVYQVQYGGFVDTPFTPPVVFLSRWYLSSNEGLNMK